MKRHSTTVRIELLLILVLLGFANQARGQACTPPPSGLVAWWPGDGNYNDIVGSNNGTPANNVLFQAGEVGQAFSLNEPGPVPFNCPSCADIAITNNLPSSPSAVTVAAWVYPDQSQLSTGFVEWVYTQFWQQAGGPGTSGPQLGIVPTQILWRPNGDDEGGISFAIPANAWTFLAGTYDSVTGSSLFYVNGNLVSSRSLPAGPIPLTYAPYIGKRIDYSHNHGQEYWVGRIDELQIFSRALSASEIQTIYNAGSAGECKTYSSQLSFQAPMSLSLPNTGNDVTIGDFNRDGILDIAATTNVPPTDVAENFVFLGIGGGAFGPPTTFDPSPGCFSAGQLKTADINNDGISDLILALGGTANGCNGVYMSVQLGDGMGGFGPPILTTAGGSLLSFATGDFNEDGKLDLAARSADDRAILILLGQGDGNFTLEEEIGTGLGQWPENIVAVDLNGDGHLDLAATYADGVRVFFGDGMGNFSNPVLYPITNPSFFGIAWGDFNEDGIPDLAVSNGSQGAVYVLLGTGGGQFSTPVAFPAGTNPQSEVIVADFDRDGHQDIAVGNCNANTVTVLKGNGHGGFAAPATFPAGQGSSCRLASADLNNDGLQDLVTTSQAGASVLLNSTPLNQQNYQLTVSTSGSGTVTSRDGGINCPSTCGNSYPANTPVTLDATPAQGWTFAGWGGACSGSGTGSCTVTMSQDLSVTATFTQNSGSYTLSVAISGSGTVTSIDGFINCPGTCSYTYPGNTHVILNASPGQGGAFAGWNGACTGIGPCSVTMTQNQFVTASFTAQPDVLTHSFGTGNDGQKPFGSLVLDAAGNLYGTTSMNGLYGKGTVFEVSPNGTETVLYNFGNGSNDGQKPLGNLIFDSAGNLYGTTSEGGAFGNGTVFQLSPNGTETVLYNFGNGGDGQNPDAGLIFDTSNNLYGTTANGGAFGNGTVFELSPNGTGGWSETVLYSFGSGGDGQNPEAGLVLDTSGNLYGTTVNGGAFGGGTVFQLSTHGCCRENLVHSFGNGADGRNPFAGVIFDSSGNLYGTTANGGGNSGGTAFELSPSGGGGWTETFLYSFGSGTDGANPFSTLVFDNSGDLYGTTQHGGLNSEGTIFELSPSSHGCCREGLVYSFGTGANDGQNPYAGLAFSSTSGTLYGTTVNGGVNSGGTVFALAPRRPFVGLFPTALDFGFQGVAIPNTPQKVTLANTGIAPLVISAITITGANTNDFSESNDCPISPSTLAPGRFCHITVVFSPVDSGTVNADVTITDNAGNNPQMVQLTGTSVGGRVRPR